MHASRLVALLAVAMATALAGCDRKPAMPPKPSTGAVPSSSAVRVPAPLAAVLRPPVVAPAPDRA